MKIKQVGAAIGAAGLVGLCCTAGGCGSTSSGASSGVGGGLQCSFDTFMQAPVKRQITATSSVTCDFTVVTAETTLVILARKTGSGDSAWDAFYEPAQTSALPPNSLTYKVTCLGGHDYEASADITGTGPQGQPFHAHETSPVASYTAADCTQN
jgi:hypothetical protein